MPPEGQQEREYHADPHHHDSSVPEAVQSPAVFFCPLVLGHKDGDGLAAADAEGLAEVLHAGGGGKGGDGGGADAVDGALYDELAQVETGLLEGGHRAIAGGEAHQRGVHAHVGALDHQEGLLFSDIHQAQQGGEELGAGGGQGGPLDAQPQLCHQHPGRPQVVPQGDEQEEQGRLGVADGRRVAAR